MQRLAITLRKKIRKMLFKSSKGMMNLEWRVRNYWIIYFATTYFSVLYRAIADIRKYVDYLVVVSRYNMHQFLKIKQFCIKGQCIRFSNEFTVEAQHQVKGQRIFNNKACRMCHDTTFKRFRQKMVNCACKSKRRRTKEGGGRIDSVQGLELQVAHLNQLAAFITCLKTADFYSQFSPSLNLKRLGFLVSLGSKQGGRKHLFQGNVV